MFERFASTLVLLVISLPLGACADGEIESGPDLAAQVAAPAGQLNVTILLDLSDRVDPETNPATPSHRERDLAAVGAVVNAFVSEMEAKGAFAAESRIRTIFSPAPIEPDVNEIAQGLSQDLRGMSPAAMKVVHDSLAGTYRSGLGRIYDAVLEQSNYVGADVWRFFKDGDAERFAVDPDPDVRNVLVILTDGYAYHEDTVLREGNRTTYVTGPLLVAEGLRDVASARERFDAGDYGFLDAEVNLPNLEVLVLELDPADGHPGDFEVLKAYWEGWFDSMGITHFVALKSDLPTNTRPLIRDFFQNE